MSVHVNNRFYCFHHSFCLSRHSECLSAGTYCLETYEQIVKGAYFITYEPVLALLHLHGPENAGCPGAVIPVDPEEIEYAFAMDKAKAKSVGWGYVEDGMSEQEQDLISELHRIRWPTSERSPFARQQALDHFDQGSLGKLRQN